MQLSKGEMMQLLRFHVNENAANIDRIIELAQALKAAYEKSRSEFEEMKKAVNS